MNDLDICNGTGDYPSCGCVDNHTSVGWKPTQKEILEMQHQGLVQDSTGSWWNPNNYMDSYSMDW